MDPEHKEMMSAIIAGMESMRAELAENTRTISQILKGFPEGDPDGHRRYHEEVIQQAAERRMLLQEVRMHLLKAASWPALAGAFYVMWQYFKSQVTK